MRTDARGWVLMEAVILGCLVLAAAVVLGIFARSTMRAEQSAAYGCGILGAAGTLGDGGGT